MITRRKLISVIYINLYNLFFYVVAFVVFVTTSVFTFKILFMFKYCIMYIHMSYKSYHSYLSSVWSYILLNIFF